MLLENSKIAYFFAVRERFDDEKEKRHQFCSGDVRCLAFSVSILLN